MNIYQTEAKCIVHQEILQGTASICFFFPYLHRHMRGTPQFFSWFCSLICKTTQERSQRGREREQKAYSNKNQLTPVLVKSA
jgi:hypothetical protein